MGNLARKVGSETEAHEPSRAEATFGDDEEALGGTEDGEGSLTVLDLRNARPRRPCSTSSKAANT